MKNRKQWYILGGLLIVLAGIFMGRLIEGWERNQSTKVQAAILMKKGSEQEFSDLMSGIRDYARENGILIHVNYMMDAENLEKVLREEKELGSVGALILCPEDFEADEELQKGDRNLPVLVIGREQLKSEYRLEEKEILQLLEGELDRLVVINEYQMGYSAVDALIKAEGKERLSEIPVEYLTITPEELDSGKYNALLSDR